jgi:hypothetical protein
MLCTFVNSHHKKLDLILTCNLFIQGDATVVKKYLTLLVSRVPDRLVVPSRPRFRRRRASQLDGRRRTKIDRPQAAQNLHAPIGRVPVGVLANLRLFFR